MTQSDREDRNPPGRGFRSDERWELAQRIGASELFQRSSRLREFLFYVVERAIDSPSTEIHEREIAAQVFGRPAVQDPGDDSIVRVHASQLRRRLSQYFESEAGAQERLILEIPRRNYAPVFRQRIPPTPPDPARHYRTALWALGAVAALLVALSLWQWRENASMRRKFSPDPGSEPALAAFWSQLFHPGQATDIVLADSSLSFLQDILSRPVSLNEYLDRGFQHDVDALRDPLLRFGSSAIMKRQYTSFADATLLHKILSLRRDPVPHAIFFARDFLSRHLRDDNVILIGSRRSTPWSELIEDRLNFRFGFDEQNRSATYANLNPRPGEQPVYHAQYGSGRGRASYCLVAFIPNLGGSGRVLLIAGTEMEGTEGGGEFVTSERWLARLRQLLHLAPGDPFPCFEVLLKTAKVGGAAPEFEIVATRVHATH